MRLLQLLRARNCRARHYSANAAKAIDATDTGKQQELVEVFIDGASVRVPPSTPVIQACRLAGKDIPRFCYHDRLAIAGNCRMCLVQVEKMPKMVASCAQPVSAGMRVVTDSAAVRKAREGVMEFLLANHPLDCPVCDQGGECDLQDQSMAFGSDRSRFRLDVQGKRAVEDKYLGPLVKTSMNRCIHCTRCVRFANELAGVPELGTTGRGNDMQIGTYVEKVIRSELSGNIIDLCPVGALTSRPYAFRARPWELKKTSSVDVFDGLGSAIRVDSRGDQVYRVLPRENADINEEWLGDKSRFACDALAVQRLATPLIKNSQGRFEEASWSDALDFVGDKIRSADPKRVQAVVGDFADAESMYLLREMLQRLNCGNLSLDSDNPGTSLRRSALASLNGTITEVESSDCILIVGANVRHEAPLLNLRIRKNYLNTNVHIGLVGPRTDLTYEYDHLGDTFDTISKYRDRLAASRRPVILVSQAALAHSAGHLLRLFRSTKSLVRLSVLNRTASRTAALQLGYGLPPTPNPKVTLSLGGEFGDQDRQDQHSPPSPGDFRVYVGHHAGPAAYSASVILPAAAYTEKEGLFMNVEGRLQSTVTAVPPPMEARPDWAIVRALAECVGVNASDMPSSLKSVRQQVYSDLDCALDQVMRPAVGNDKVASDLEQFMAANPARGDFRYPIDDYYMSDVISRNSPTMAACSRELR